MAPEDPATVETREGYAAYDRELLEMVDNGGSEARRRPEPAPMCDTVANVQYLLKYLYLVLYLSRVGQSFEVIHADEP